MAPKGPVKSMKCSARLAPPTVMLEESQITAPAGMAKITARHNTMRVRSMTEV